LPDIRRSLAIGVLKGVKFGEDKKTNQGGAPCA
jgi:hypothetical protein